jgi:hypothetical protein
MSASTPPPVQEGSAERETSSVELLWDLVFVVADARRTRPWPGSSTRATDWGERRVLVKDACLRQRHFLTENANTVVELYGLPGFRVVVGKLGWLGELGKCWVSSVNPSPCR